MNRDEIVLVLSQFRDRNKTKYNIIKMGVFGSVARNKIADESDIDIVVQLGKQDLFNLIGIKQDLEEQLNRKVDIVSYREKMNRFLKHKIDNEAIYV
ncbi:MAG: nucleotidyltransferase [Desulfobacterales bacterium S5133MH16]|nr:MAG: nucleotidyltransferase [Desulfobacterales bacterium S5133MH16]